MSASARVQVSVYDTTGKAKSTLKMPAVLVSNIRSDIVHDVHRDMSKNRRQPYAVKDMAGMGHSAESWGTGRAVARIPRISGSGTSRSGQGAFGNMCRKGRMFAPTKVWRRWHRRINLNQKRFAVTSALAASALPSIVMARGHRIDNVPEIPLVVDSAVESITKTSQALNVLKALGANDDVQKAKDSRKLRSGVGKLRNRRYVNRRGPLVVYSEDHGVKRAFRNLPGVDLLNVNQLNLLKLAPGGHLGRFVIWTQGAFEKLNDVFGSFRRLSAVKKGFHLAHGPMYNSDLQRIINSDEIQSKIRPAKRRPARRVIKKNPLKNLQAKIKLNPYAAALRRTALATAAVNQKARAKKLEAIRAGKPYERTPTEIKKLAEKKLHKKTKHHNIPPSVDGDIPVQKLSDRDFSKKTLKAAKAKLVKATPQSRDVKASALSKSLQRKAEIQSQASQLKVKMIKKQVKAKKEEEKKRLAAAKTAAKPAGKK